MTIDELVQSYIKRIETVGFEEDDIKKIISEIEKLTYETTKQTISHETQLEIIEKMEHTIDKKQICISEQENIKYLNLLRVVRKELDKQKQNLKGKK